MLTACGTNSTSVRTDICPDVIHPTKTERTVMKEKIPAFYVRFTNQQTDLMECKKDKISTTQGKVDYRAMLSPRDQAMVDQVMSEYRAGYVVPMVSPQTTGITPFGAFPANDNYSIKFIQRTALKVHDLANKGIYNK